MIIFKAFILFIGLNIIITTTYKIIEDDFFNQNNSYQFLFKKKFVDKLNTLS